MPAPKKPVPCVCCREFSSQSAVNRHLKVACNGLLPLQCGKCFELFDNKWQKYEHSLLPDCTVPNSESPVVNPVPHGAEASTSTAVVNATNTVETNNGSINNIAINGNNNIVVNLNATPVAINDYLNTNTQAVIDSISKNPAFMQLAHENDRLPEAVLEETHFKGAPENRNVYSSEQHGKYMKVRTDGRKTILNKNTGLAHSIRNVNTIVNSPEVKPFFEDDPDKPVLPIPETRSEVRALRTRHDDFFKRGL